MLRVFTEYRRTAVLGVCVTAAVTAILIAMGEGAFSIFIAILGLWLTWLFSLNKAIRAHQKVLDVLYQEMDARRFIEVYSARMASARSGSAFEAAMRAHIGNAHMLLGEYEEALRWFTSTCPRGDVRLLMAENRAACLQRMKSPELAGAVEAWKQAMAGVKPAKRRVSEQSLRMLEIRCAVDEHRADEQMQALVQESAQTSNKRSYRVSMHLLLAKIELQRGFSQAARDELERIAQLKADTQEIREAKALLEEMNSRGAAEE